MNPFWINFWIEYLEWIVIHFESNFESICYSDWIEFTFEFWIPLALWIKFEWFLMIYELELNSFEYFERFVIQNWIYLILFWLNRISLVLWIHFESICYSNWIELLWYFESNLDSNLSSFDIILIELNSHLIYLIFKMNSFWTVIHIWIIWYFWTQFRLELGSFVIILIELNSYFIFNDFLFWI